jgi:hypothetical protein
MEDSASNNVAVKLPFGHSATLEPTETGATLMIRGLRGEPALEVEIQMTEAGPSLRKRTWSVKTPAAAPAVLPAPGEGSGGPRLSVQQYASLRAECVAATPAALAAIRKRYGLDEKSDEAETKAWGKKFASDSALFDTYKRLFQQYRSSPSSPPAGGATGGSSPSVLASTQALAHQLSLGEHAAMTAELRVRPEAEVYAKYDLADPAVRAEVLRICEARLSDPTTKERWTKLHDLALSKLTTP